MNLQKQTISLVAFPCGVAAACSGCCSEQSLQAESRLDVCLEPDTALQHSFLSALMKKTPWLWEESSTSGVALMGAKAFHVLSVIWCFSCFIVTAAFPKLNLQLIVQGKGADFCTIYVLLFVAAYEFKYCY